jgi:hypothetical protein
MSDSHPGSGQHLHVPVLYFEIGFDNIASRSEAGLKVFIVLPVLLDRRKPSQFSPATQGRYCIIDGADAYGHLQIR